MPVLFVHAHVTAPRHKLHLEVVQDFFCVVAEDFSYSVDFLKSLKVVGEIVNCDVDISTDFDVEERGHLLEDFTI